MKRCLSGTIHIKLTAICTGRESPLCVWKVECAFAIIYGMVLLLWYVNHMHGLHYLRNWCIGWQFGGFLPVIVNVIKLKSNFTDVVAPCFQCFFSLIISLCIWVQLSVYRLVWDDLYLLFFCLCVCVFVYSNNNKGIIVSWPIHLCNKYFVMYPFNVIFNYVIIRSNSWRKVTIYSKPPKNQTVDTGAVVT